VHPAAAYVVGLLLSWPPVTAAIVFYRRELSRPDRASAAEIVAGLALIVFEGSIFWRVHHDLGTARLAGKTELKAGERWRGAESMRAFVIRGTRGRSLRSWVRAFWRGLARWGL
jgi:hypothetical protein